MCPIYAIRCIVLTAIASLALSACSQGFFQDLSELSPLRNQLIQTYHEDNVTVIIQNGNALGISFTNSAFNDLPTREAKQAKAREIAQVVKDNYSRIDHIDMVWVSFTIHKQYIIFNYTNSLDTFFFDTKSLNSRPARRMTATAAPVPKDGSLS